MNKIKIRIKPQENRLDKFISREVKTISRSQAKKLINTGQILVNDRSVEPDYELSKGDEISITLSAPTPSEIKPENLPLNIVYEDDDLLVIDKKDGMVVHPTIDHPSGTLVNALLFHLKLPSENIENLRPGIVHRLDKGTSGLLVVAKNSDSLEKLKNQFKSRTVQKKYIALVAGKLEPPAGLIEKPIARHGQNRQKFAVSPEGKSAETYYNVLEYIQGKKATYSLVGLEPKTGRTHQLRVHLSSLGHPIVGDRLYGGQPASRIFLHAKFLEFDHPVSKKKMSFESILPENLTAMIDKLKNKSLGVSH